MGRVPVWSCSEDRCFIDNNTVNACNNRKDGELTKKLIPIQQKKHNDSIDSRRIVVRNYRGLDRSSN